jgi:hypothetical protein
MASTRTKRERRERAWSYKGNAQVADQFISPVGLAALIHPNRLMERFRQSQQRGRDA